MLSRLATQPLARAHSRRALTDAVSSFAVASSPDERALARLVERRLKSVASSLNVVNQELPSLDDLKRWRHVVEVEDIDEAIKNGGDLRETPSWAILFLLSSKVNSPVQAMSAVSIMLRHFPKADISIQPSLLILTARFLARRNVTLPMPNLVRAFLMLNLSEPSTQLNLLLRSISHFRPTPEITKATTRILDAMSARQVRLHSRTYRSLLSNKLVTPELAKTLQRRMQRESFIPNTNHLEAYLRVFAKQGAVHASARYLNLIRKLRIGQGREAPHGVNLSSQGAQAQTEGSVNTRWNTEFLSSFGRHTGSAFYYLRALVGDGIASTTAIRPVRNESRISCADRKNSPLTWKRDLHVSDWTVVLNIAARDPKISGERLLSLFKQARAVAHFPLTVGVFTAIMRGLVKKGDYTSAYEIWEWCCSTWYRRRRIDKKALTVAMDVLVASGQPLSAFDTLIETTGIVRNKNAVVDCGHAHSRRAPNAERALYSRAAKIDAPLVNALMDAYVKHGRPDIVFKLWDAYVPLFGIAPNAETLTVLLKAAREGARFDHTFRGLIERMGLHGLFHRKKMQLDYRDKSKLQIVQDLRDIVNKEQMGDDEGARVERYVRKSLWDGELAAPRALVLFKAILAKNFPDLPSIRPPATAVWPDEAHAGHPMRDALRTLAFGRRKDKQLEDEAQKPTIGTPLPFLVGPVSALAVTSSSPLQGPTFTSTIDIAHPQIVPNEKTFAAYIALLGAQDRASEISITLAWMRALDVVPTRGPLALALALWSEASVRGPLLESYGGVSEYERLYHWLVKWLGRERMPTDAAIASAFQNLKRDRDK
ncbi:hypothetical protein EW145_g3282 [Phellinidium pouzarii]|uniref:Pentacotripeptide-repeat region of PRORP domain-containing protein n=1 Tax=Phellinidium pouzarii TaxID=167371 RepID=A0A4S4L7M8_9AGAM|nr:hypothetical protein EW145_g3282 [Phellinidium pouzarii]